MTAVDFPTPSLTEMLDALDGTAYATDLDGRLVSVGPDSWSSFARENADDRLADSPPIGDRLADAISGQTVRAFYQGAHEAALSGERRIAFAFRCDAPDVERRMKMTISPLRSGNKIIGVLYQSTILSERSRPPLRYLDAATALEQYKDDAAPLISSCSFCARIDWPAGSNDAWVEPEVYYQRGGQSRVRISHGVCPDCTESMAQLVA